jgi:uncharacterized membrane protein YccC
MHSPLPEAPAAELETCLAAVEQRLAALSDALHDQNAPAIEQRATELHRALAAAVQRFGHAARSGGVPPTLRKRLARAAGQVALQRESLARATAALDRAIDVLMTGLAGHRAGREPDTTAKIPSPK